MDTLEGAPQFGQKRMLIGTGVWQLVQAWVVDCAMVFSLSISATPGGFGLGKLERLQHWLEETRVHLSKAVGVRYILNLPTLR